MGRMIPVGERGEAAISGSTVCGGQK